MTLPNKFGKFNPYGDLIHGDWFGPRAASITPGPSISMAIGDRGPKLDDVLKPVGKTPLWFGQVDSANTTIWAQFKGVDPNEQRSRSTSARRSSIRRRPGINYITVRGFTLRTRPPPGRRPRPSRSG